MERRNRHTRGLLRDTGPEDESFARRDAAVRRVALYLHESVRGVRGNLPNALLTVLCRIPDGIPLRRSVDHTILSDVRLLLEDVEADDPRRPRLEYLLEASEWRTRAVSRSA